jgi:hypothetical protein
MWIFSFRSVDVKMVDADGGVDEIGALIKWFCGVINTKMIHTCKALILSLTTRRRIKGCNKKKNPGGGTTTKLLYAFYFEKEVRVKPDFQAKNLFGGALPLLM